MAIVASPSSSTSVDARIAAIAARQHGLITSTQLRRCGLGSSAITKRMRAGRLYRVHPGVYAVGVPPTSFEARVLAAVLSVGGSAVASGRSAARLWELPVRGRSVICVTVDRRHRGLHGATVRATTAFLRGERTVRSDTPVTSVPRTIVDLADELTPHHLAHVLDHVAFRRLASLRTLTRAAALHRHRSGHPVLARALELHRAGSRGTRSQLEDHFLAMLLDVDLPEPRVNTDVQTAVGALEVDLVWPDAMLAVELDAPGHDRPAARRIDRTRDAALGDAGYTVLRVPHDWLDAGLERVAQHLSGSR